MRNLIAPLFSLILLLLAWEVTVRGAGLPGYILPPPSDIAMTLIDRQAMLLRNLGITIANTLWGFVLGAAIGLVLTCAMVWLPVLRDLLMPIAVASAAVPTVAFVPLALMWFGIGAGSKIAMATLAVSFPVLLNALAGFDASPKAQIQLLRSFGARPLAIMWKLRLPAAFPSIMTGLRIGLSRALITVIITEMLGAYAGIGQTIYRSTATVDYLVVWAAVAVGCGASLVLYSILACLDRWLIWWK
jgi:NitT/TauT family transport system permease protein